MSDCLLGPKEIAVLVKKSVLTLRKDVHRRPDTLPPRTILPGDARALRWRQSDVDAWFAGLTTVPVDEVRRGPGRPPICLQNSTEKPQQKENSVARRGRPPKTMHTGGAK